MPIKAKMKCLLLLDGCHLVPLPFLPLWVTKNPAKTKRSWRGIELLCSVRAAVPWSSRVNGGTPIPRYSGAVQSCDPVTCHNSTWLLHVFLVALRNSHWRGIAHLTYLLKEIQSQCSRKKVFSSPS